MSHLAKILLCLVVLSIPTVGSASSYAVPAVSVQNVATAIRMTGATLAVSVAVKQLLKGVDFVMDPENNQARSKEKVDYCSHGGTPCVNTPEEAVKYAMQSNFAVHWKYPFKGCKLNPRQGNGTINCTFEKDGDIRTIAFFNFNTIVKSASYEEIAEQIIANAKMETKKLLHTCNQLQIKANQNLLRLQVHQKMRVSPTQNQLIRPEKSLRSQNSASLVSRILSEQLVIRVQKYTKQELMRANIIIIFLQ